MSNKGKIVVGLSGGVDSSVAAAILKEEGYDVHGISMEIFDGSIPIKGMGKHACYGPDEKEDIRSAINVCKKLGIPFHLVDLKKEFKEHVIGYFKREYLSGRTPNPCIVCNQRLKFGFLLDKVREAGIDYDLFATGHYARIKEIDGCLFLKKARARSKDQTYFLYALTPEQLSRTRFPLGEYDKKKVREIAQSLGLSTSDRPESQDFITGGDYSPLFDKAEIKEGDIVTEKGETVGRHRGIIHYTIGQRRGLGIAAANPLYVRGIDAERNRIIVGDRKALYSRGLIAGDLHFPGTGIFDRSIDVKAKIRLNHRAADVTISPVKDKKAEVLFKEPQLSITPGQSVVFYQDDIVLGGGIIEKMVSSD